MYVAAFSHVYLPYYSTYSNQTPKQPVATASAPGSMWKNIQQQQNK